MDGGRDVCTGGRKGSWAASTPGASPKVTRSGSGTGSGLRKSKDYGAKFNEMWGSGNLVSVQIYGFACTVSRLGVLMPVKKHCIWNKIAASCIACDLACTQAFCLESFSADHP